MDTIVDSSEPNLYLNLVEVPTVLCFSATSEESLPDLVPDCDFSDNSQLSSPFSASSIISEFDEHGYWTPLSDSASPSSKVPKESYTTLDCPSVVSPASSTSASENLHRTFSPPITSSLSIASDIQAESSTQEASDCATQLYAVRCTKEKLHKKRRQKRTNPSLLRGKRALLGRKNLDAEARNRGSFSNSDDNNSKNKCPERWSCKSKCGATFTRMSDLKRHQSSPSCRLYTGDTSGLYCDLCGRKVSRRDALLRHQRTSNCYRVQSPVEIVTDGEEGMTIRRSRRC